MLISDSIITPIEYQYVADIKIRKNDYQNKIALTIYLEGDELYTLKSVSVLKNTTVQKTIGNLVKSTASTTKSNLPSDFNICDMVSKYNKGRNC